MTKKLPTTILRMITLLILLLEAVVMHGQLLDVNQEVSGSVLSSEDNAPLEGVTVIVKGTKTGALTDAKGQFKVTVPDGKSTLIFSYYGFERQEVSLDGKKNLNIVMQQNVSSLDEVVVVGYGTQQKRFITGAITKVSESEIANVPNTSVQSTLQGRAAGVQVTTSDAMAGAPVLIRVRGTSSVSASSEPLYVVDGIPIVSGNYSHNSANNFNLATAHESNALVQLNPADIESIEILKDAAASAIYGSRGANGVVLITTKQGKGGKTKFDVGYYSGVSKETNRIEMLDGPTYLKLAKMSWDNSGRPTDNDYELFWNSILPQGLTREVAEATDTDWIDFNLRRGFMQEANVSASGGNDKTTFYVGSTYRDEKGIFVGNNFTRLNARVNLDHKVGKKFALGVRTAFTVVDNEQVPSSWAGGLGLAQSTALPFYPVYNEDGTFFNPKAGYNIVAEQQNTQMNTSSNSIIGNVYAQVNLTPNLYIRSEFGINNIYKKEFYYKSAVIEPQGISTSVLSENINWNTNNILNYSLNLGNHKLEFLGGMNAQHNDFNMHIINGEGFANPGFTNPQNAATQTASINLSAYSFISFFGRVNYRIKDRYLLGVSIRRDGSSRFGPAKRWGNFPAASLGYIISEEAFLKNSKVISFLKVRGGAGITGNAEIGNFQYFGSYGTSNYINQPGITVANLSNPSLGWETSYQYDVGVDFGLLTGRIQGSIDAYLKNTRDFLLNVEVSALTGASSATNNLGSLINRGFEFDITSYNLTGKFKWNTNLNLSFNENEVTKLAPNLSFAGLFGGGSVIEVGYPVGVRNLVRWEGIAADDMTLEVTDPRTMEKVSIDVNGGDELFLNQFDELTNIFDPSDATFVGNAYPRWIGGLRNEFSYKGFDFNALFTFALGHDLENSEQRFQNSPFGRGWNAWASLADTWTEQGDQTDVQKFHWLSSNRNYTTTRYLHDASYLRLKDVTLGYTIPERVLTRMGLSYLRIFVKGTNALTFTKYPGWDPEYNRDGADSDNYGKSWLPSPQAKSITAGLNLSF